MINSQVPVARKENLVIQEMPDEVLVYDLTANKAHCLNKTAALVWKSCDGSQTVAQIAGQIEKQSGSSVPEDLIWLAIDQLNEKNLLETEIKADFKGSTRREVIKKIGLAAVIAIPLVSSLTAPTSILAFASCSCGAATDCGAGTTQPNCPANCNTSTGTCGCRAGTAKCLGTA